MFDWIADPAIWASLVTLTAMEIVLGIDNIVFISVIVGKLPPEQAKRARQIGLALALVFRVILLFSLFWLTHLEAAVFTLFGEPFSWRDLVLIAGGLFLIYKATHRDPPGRRGRARTRSRPGRRSMPASAPSSARSPSSTWCSRSTRSSPPSAWPTISA